MGRALSGRQKDMKEVLKGELAFLSLAQETGWKQKLWVVVGRRGF